MGCKTFFNPPHRKNCIEKKNWKGEKHEEVASTVPTYPVCHQGMIFMEITFQYTVMSINHTAGRPCLYFSMIYFTRWLECTYAKHSLYAFYFKPPTAVKQILSRMKP
jgi:hypothetical protein